MFKYIASLAFDDKIDVVPPIFLNFDNPDDVNGV